MVLLTQLACYMVLQQVQSMPPNTVKWRCASSTPLTPQMTVAQRKTRINYILKQQVSRYGSRQLRTPQAEKALMQIMYKESTYRTWAKNPQSSAYGLGGFLNSTWKSVGITKTSCPDCQIYGIIVYVERRYGTAENALHHHNRKGWY